MAETGKNPEALLRGGLSWNAASVLSAHAINFARYAIVARLLSLDAFGLFAMANVVVIGAQMLSNWGWRQAFIAQQGAEEDPVRRQRALWTADLLVRAGAVLLLCVSAPLIARGFGRPELAGLIALSSLYVLAQGLRHPALMNRERQLDFRIIAVVELSGAVAGLLVAIIAAWLLGTVWALVYGQVVAALVPALVSHRAVGTPARWLIDRALIRQGFGFGRHVLGLSALGWVMSQSDNAMIGAALGASALGLYALAYRLCEIPKLVQDTVISRTVYPYYVQAARRGIADLGRAWMLTTRYTLWLLWFAYLPMLLAPEALLGLLFGAPWLPAADALRILATAGVLRGFNNVLAQVFLSTQQPAVELRIKLCETVLFLAAITYGALVVGSIEAVAVAGILGWGSGFAVRIVLAGRVTQLSAGTLLSAWKSPLAGLGAMTVLAPALLWLPGGLTLVLSVALLSALFLGLERAQLKRLRG